MRFGHIEIFVSDPMRSKEFYIDVLGFQLVENQNDQFIWLKNSTSLFLLRPLRNTTVTDTYQTAPNAFVLYTDDLDASRKQLESRGVEIRGTDGSPNCLTFTDPDGNWFQLVNPNSH